MPQGEHKPMNPLVSVIMSTFNRQESLARAIDSVLTQRYSPLELIIIDDGSTDHTSEILQLYDDVSQVNWMKNPANIGLPASLNKGIQAAKGKYIARIDDDDFWIDPDKLIKQVTFLENNAECALLGTSYIDEKGQIIMNPLKDSTIRKQILFRCPFYHSSVLIRAAALNAAGGYDDSLPYTEDWDLWLRIGMKWRLENLVEVTLRKMQGSNTMSERYFTQQFEIIGRLDRNYGRYYPCRWRARLYHAAIIQFFGIFPVNGAFHRKMGKVFLWAFGLRFPNS